MKLSDKDWGSFLIGSLFSVQRPPARNKDEYEVGDIPFVASGAVNNGVMKFCKPLENERLDKGGCITVSPVDGSAFYQPYSFLGRGGAGSSVLMLYSDNLNFYSGQFIAKMIANTCACKYTYGHMGNKDGIKRERIMLPIDENNNPDYKFMEDYVRELTEKNQKQYRDYCQEQLKILGEGYSPVHLSDRQWKAFYISDEKDNGIFKLRASLSGIDKNKLTDCKDTDIPYITRSDFNNGVAMFVGHEQNAKYKIDAGNVITVGLDTQTVFYQPHSFYTGQNIQVLYNEHLNKYVAKFIIPLLKMQVSKLSWGGNGATLGRLKRMQLLLPISDDGRPDYAFMEEFIKKREVAKRKEYLGYCK